MARGLERRDTSSERNRTNGIFKGRGRRRIPGGNRPGPAEREGPSPAPSRRLRFEDEDTGQDSPSGHDGPKSKSGKFQEDSRKARPSDRMRQEDEPGGPQDTGKARSRRAPPRRPGAKRTSTRKRRPKRSAPGKSWERPGRSWIRPRRNGRRRSRRGLQRKLSGEPAPRHGFISTTKSTKSNMKMWAWKEPINPS